MAASMSGRRPCYKTNEQFDKKTQKANPSARSESTKGFFALIGQKEEIEIAMSNLKGQGQ